MFDPLLQYTTYNKKPVQIARKTARCRNHFEKSN